MAAVTSAEEASPNVGTTESARAAFGASIANIFFAIPALSLAVSAAFVLLSSLLIMWQTSAIIHGGETNYIMATVTLFVSIYNLFMSLLHLLTALSGND